MDSRSRITPPADHRSHGPEGFELPDSRSGAPAKTARRVARVSWLLAAAMVLAWIQDVSGADICFQRTACVSTSTVLLRDIAIVAASDPATMTRLENVVLAPAPAPGRRMRLEFAEIRSRLEATGIPPGQLNYSGSSVVVVASTDAPAPVKAKPKKPAKARSVVAPNQLKRAEQIMTEAVRRSMHTKPGETSTKFIDVIVDPADARSVLTNAAQTFEIGAFNPKSTEPQAIQVAYQDSQGQPARFQVQCVVSERPQVPVLTCSVAAGDVIHESDLAWQPVDSTKGLLTRLDDIVDKEAKKSLHADEPIRADDVRAVPLVRNNDIVTGIWRSGGIRITGQFKAKGDGGLGDVITLVKLTGRDQVTARVTDVHEAEIVNVDRAKSADRGEDRGDDAVNRASFARRSSPDRTTKPPRPAANAVTPAAFVEQR
jgi:flagellar basal body P-ring formation protein FlgA